MIKRLIYLIATWILFGCGATRTQQINIVNDPPPAKSAIVSSATSSTVQFWGFNGNISAGNLTYNDTSFIKAVAALKPDIIRYPGGILSANFDWKTGYKETQPKGNKYDLLDLKNVINKAPNLKVIFVLNLWHTVDDQILMLQTAQSLGFNISYVEMGNEISNADNAGRIRFQNSGKIYADTCLAWQKKIKTVFPNVKIALWGENKIDLRDWLSGILSVYKPDALVAHIYPNASVFMQGDSVNTYLLGKQLSHALVSSGVYGSGLPIWITETNVDPNSLNLLSDKQHTQALLFMLNRYKSLTRIKLVCVHNVVGEDGVIDSAYNLLPSGLAFKQFRP